jgi:hypothetical protein
MPAADMSNQISTAGSELGAPGSFSHPQQPPFRSFLDQGSVVSAPFIMNSMLPVFSGC